jgi:hypothetical protein
MDLFPLSFREGLGEHVASAVIIGPRRLAGRGEPL